jgi:epoxyqueuosine reductase
MIKNRIPAHGRVFVDSGPVLEKALAEKSGLGWIGKNTLLLNKKRGSFFFIGEIYTNLNLPLDKVDEKNHCGSCKACIDICPTKAIVGPKQLDARKCISYLTIEYKGSIEEELRPMMGNRIFGCDDCQLVCPWNKFAQFTQEEDFKPRHNLNNSGLSELFKWTEENYLRKTKGSPIRRAGYESWSRNIAVALGNADTSKEVYESLMSRRNDPSAIVREHVKWALDQHKGKSS